jgi:hypothetical protein
VTQLRSVLAHVVGLLLAPVLVVRNRISRRRVVDPAADVAVCLTTYGARAAGVHLVIESIARGRVRPRRLVLAVAPGDLSQPWPAGIERLRRRGLEVLECDDLGPHKKYLPWTLSADSRRALLVTADDDVYYPRGWLAGLLRARAEDPTAVWCYRARRLVTADDLVEPYRRWPLWSGRGPSPRMVPTGVSGVLHPPALSEEVRRRGAAAAEVAPRADDLWLHGLAVGAGIPVRQVRERATHFPVAPSTRRGALMRANLAGGNDEVVARLYSGDVLDRILREA